MINRLMAQAALFSMSLAFSLSAYAACQEVTASNSAHVTAGRAEIKNQTCYFSFCYGGTYYAKGSGEILGTSAYTSTSLYSNQTGVWQKGTCPQVANQAPVCHSISYEMEKQSVDYIGSWMANIQASDPDGDAITVETKIDLPEYDWVVAQAAGTSLRAALTSDERELTLGQEYVIVARATDSKGEVGYCPQASLIAVDALGPHVTGPSQIAVNLGAVFDPLEPSIGIGISDNYDITELLTLEVTQNTVNTQIPGDYTVVYKGTDSKGNSDAISQHIMTVTVVDPNVNRAPVIESFSYTVNGRDLRVTGTVSDPDGNDDVNEIYIRYTRDLGQMVCTGTTTFTCDVLNQPLGTFYFDLIAFDKGGKPSEPTAEFSVTFADSSECFTATNQAHVTAARATLKYNILVYANGSNTYLGLTSATTTLKKDASGKWQKVNSCP